MARASGGELVVETLKAAGVDTVFGIVSVHNIPIYDTIERLGGIRPVPVRQERRRSWPPTATRGRPARSALRSSPRGRASPTR